MRQPTGVRSFTNNPYKDGIFDKQHFGGAVRQDSNIYAFHAHNLLTF